MVQKKRQPRLATGAEAVEQSGCDGLTSTGTDSPDRISYQEFRRANAEFGQYLRRWAAAYRLAATGETWGASMNAALPIGPRIAAAVALLSSDKDGEVVAAARAIGRMLQARGLSWPDFASVVANAMPALEEPEAVDWPPDRNPFREACMRTTDQKAAAALVYLCDVRNLSAWERRFAASLWDWNWAHGGITPRQRAKLVEIARQHGWTGL